MTIKIIGDHPMTRDASGRRKVLIASIFLRGKALVTLPGTHAMQRNYYIDYLNQERTIRAVRLLTAEERAVEWEQSVDLILDNETILIRPDPSHMDRAFAADELLQEIFHKNDIKFLHATDATVKQAIKERGELWRIAPLPHEPKEIKDMIAGARTAIGNDAIYYYNRLTGVRYLTYQEFCKLESMPQQKLAHHLQEIADFSNRFNRKGKPEVDFFLAGSAFGHSNFKGRNFLKAPPATLLEWYKELRGKFMNAVPPGLREDDSDITEWRQRMTLALLAAKDDILAEEILQGLSQEFFLQIRWLPGARIQDGELIWDSVFDECEAVPGSFDLHQLCDWRARNLIFNFNRDYTDVEYINVGRIERSLSEREQKRRTPAGNPYRGVYIVDIKRRESDGARIRIIRMQKWGIAHRLNKGTDLLEAMIQTDDYTEFILDRRLACRQLGMNLPSWLITRTMSEEYHGSNNQYEGKTIQSHYFEREYVNGIATHNIPAEKFAEDDYALAFSHFLGDAAAVNIIVGRGDDLKLQAEIDQGLGDVRKGVLFDDGDEVVILNERGIPQKIVVADHTGAFHHYNHDLTEYAHAYALPILSRLNLVVQKEQFAEVYLNAFMTRFLYIQNEYRERRRAFDNLFKHRPPPDGNGNLTDRWASVLKRLDQTDVQTLTDAIRKQIKV